MPFLAYVCCFVKFPFGVLTYLDVLDIVNVWDNVSKFIEKQMALQKVCKFSRVLKFLFTHVQWNVSCTAISRVYYFSRKFYYRYCRSLSIK